MKEKQPITIGKSCDNCAYFDVDQHKCTNPDGLFYPILHVISDSMAQATHDCEAFDEAKYRISPKGCLYYALDQADVQLDTDVIEEVWKFFADAMRNCGYVKDDDEPETTNNDND